MIPMPQLTDAVPQALPVGAAVGSFVLRGEHSRDAFGIRYLATASSSGGEVLIEEFAPAGLSVREPSGLLAPLSPAHALLWDEGLQAFVQESQVLGGALHPALMRVASLWRIRGTAFRMWPRVEGRTLAEVCETMDEPPTEAWLRGLIVPLLDALESLHGAGWVHGNVRPGQILMRDDGRPMLLDTGAVHKTIGARMPQHPAWPEPGFRPPELDEGANGQVPGPWSDLYSLAAVARFCMQAPCSAQDWEPLAGRSSAHEGSRFAAALERALLSDTQKRPASVAVFRRQLLAAAATVAAVPLPSQPASRHAPSGFGDESIDDESSPEPRPAWLEPMHADRPWEQEGFQAPRARRWPKLVAGGLGAIMLAAVAAYQLNGYEAEPRAMADSAGMAAAPLPARSPPVAGKVLDATPERGDSPIAVTPLADPEPAPAPAPVPMPAQPPLPASEPPSALGELRDRVASSSLRQVPAAPAVPVAATPQAQCAPRTQFALYRCMKTQCEQRRFADHPQCVRLRLTDEPPG